MSTELISIGNRVPGKRDTPEGIKSMPRTRQLAYKLWSMALAEAGNLDAARYVSDRLAGRPAQEIKLDQAQPTLVFQIIDPRLPVPELSDHVTVTDIVTGPDGLEHGSWVPDPSSSSQAPEQAQDAVEGDAVPVCRCKHGEDEHAPTFMHGDSPWSCRADGCACTSFSDITEQQDPDSPAQPE